MKKENIFDLYAAQHKDEPEPNAERVPGEVKPEDVAPAQEAAPTQDPEPKQEAAPEPTQEPAQETQEGGNEDGA